MTTDLSNALWYAEQAAKKAIERHDEARKNYIVVLFSDGPMDERAKRREELRDARLVLECTGMALDNARRAMNPMPTRRRIQRWRRRTQGQCSASRHGRGRRGGQRCGYARCDSLAGKGRPDV